jgi:hypothetical protein
MNTRRLVLLLFLGLMAAPAWAHKPSDSYLKISRDGPRLRVEWDIALKDLEYIVGLDTDGDGRITWGELKTRRRDVVAHALDHLQVTANGDICQLRMKQLMATEHSDGGYAVLVLEAVCPAEADELSLHYNLLFDADPTHRGLVLFEENAATVTHVLSADAPAVILRAADTGLLKQFVAFVRVGIWHILIGFDHILFLAALLLPAVFERREECWSPVTQLRPTVNSVLKIVTVFTVAHSITLWLASTGYVTLPSRLVEAGIALSIVVTAINNLYPVLPLSGWVVAFGFGLVHGFGFANVLIDLGLRSSSLAVTLLSFNVGVELGQLLIVLVFLPLAFLMRSTVFYRSLVFRFGSVLVAIMGAMWTVERIFNLKFIGV